ncbi:restriction endonuclease subunit S [Psychrobacter immobilis]|uniref:restriction endonuclease subunit S n=1 Tax=Psychrobacter immobilis TaxID=498 RepID=UPI00191B78EF|nr:restriction endonuclease subunit S [Psychrobacter immobilis]
MAEKYLAYPEYKNSGVEWLGIVPSHWDTKPLKYLCTYNDDVLPDSTSKVFKLEYVDIGSVSSTEGITNTENMIFENAPSRAKRIVKDGDVIVSTVRTYLEAIAPINNPPENMIVSTGFAVIRPNEYLCKGYAAYCLKAKGFIKEVVSLSVGLSYPAINATDLVGIKIPSLPFNEQTQVANFLDHETAQIDTLIDKQKILIQLLKEKRQAVISHAVTKGLNPDVPMKDSGVDWLGDVPRHWVEKPLRYVGNCQNGINIGAEFFGSGFPFLSYGDAYKNVELPKLVEGLVQSTEKDRISYSVRRGDIIFTTTSETIEEIGLASTCLTEIKDATFAGFLTRFRPFTNLLYPEFSKYYFRNSKLRFFFVNEMNIVTRASLSQELLKKLPVLLPPLEEQIKIAQKLHKQEILFRKLIENAFKAIQLMQERRTALISAAVTGKIDVRSWQVPNV